MVALSLCGSLVVAAAVAGAGSTAHEARAVEVELDAPQGCSSASAFWSNLRSRTDRVRRSSPEESHAVLHIRLSRLQSKVVGELRIDDGQGETDTRKVDGSTCDEVVHALSLTVALLFDPGALLSVPSPPPASSPETPETPETKAKALDAAPRTEELPPPEKKPAVASVLAIEEPPRRAPRAVPAIEMSVGLLGLTVLSGTFSPGVQMAARKNFGRNSEQRGPDQPNLLLGANDNVEKAFRPSLDLRLTYVRNDVLVTPRYADTMLLAAGATVCPLRWTAGILTVQPCALALAGWLSARGRELDHVNTVNRFWLSAGLTIRLAALLGRGFAIEIEAGLDVPVLKRRFFASSPDNVVAETPRVSPLVGVGLMYGG